MPARQAFSRYIPSAVHPNRRILCQYRFWVYTILPKWWVAFECLHVAHFQQDSRFPEGLVAGNDKAQSVIAQPIIYSSGEILGKLSFRLDSFI